MSPIGAEITGKDFSDVVCLICQRALLMINTRPLALMN